MSDWAPDLVYPARTLYHAVYGSHDGGHDPLGTRWEYWTLCPSGHPKRKGWPVPIPKGKLITLSEAERRGLKPCSRSCEWSLGRLAYKIEMAARGKI